MAEELRSGSILKGEELVTKKMAYISVRVISKDVDKKKEH